MEKVTETEERGQARLARKNRNRARYMRRMMRIYPHWGSAMFRDWNAFFLKLSEK